MSMFSLPATTNDKGAVDSYLCANLNYKPIATGPTGNIENSAYGPTNCAERTAIFKAVSEGFREFEAIAIISDSKQPTAPCGVCRQVMAEFCSRDFQVLMLGCEGIQRTASLGELLPYAFSLEK